MHARDKNIEQITWEDSMDLEKLGLSLRESRILYGIHVKFTTFALYLHKRMK